MYVKMDQVSFPTVTLKQFKHIHFFKYNLNIYGHYISVHLVKPRGHIVTGNPVKVPLKLADFFFYLFFRKLICHQFFFGEIKEKFDSSCFWRTSEFRRNKQYVYRLEIHIYSHIYMCIVNRSLNFQAIVNS